MEKKEKIMIVSNNEMVNVPRREGSWEGGLGAAASRRQHVIYQRKSGEK